MEKKVKQKSWVYKIFVKNIDIKIMAILIAFLVTVIINIKY